MDDYLSENTEYVQRCKEEIERENGYRGRMKQELIDDPLADRKGDKNYERD